MLAENPQGPFKATAFVPDKQPEEVAPASMDIWNESSRLREVGSARCSVGASMRQKAGGGGRRNTMQLTDAAD